MDARSVEHPALTLEISVFGGIVFRVGDHILSDSGSRSLKLWNVLCFLIFHRSQAVPQEKLIELFWPNEEQRNPAGSLKMQILRIRGLLKPLLGEAVNPVLGQRGAYRWNPEILCAVDADRFLELCREDADLRSLMAAAELYKGSLLPKLSGQLWVIPLREYYRGLYIKAVTAAAARLDEAERYEEMEALCLRAVSEDRLNERLHLLVMRAMLRQGRLDDARKHYAETERLLLREMGVQPSRELQEFRRELVSAGMGPTDDLDELQAEMAEQDRRGAMYCEFEAFETLYRLEVRRMPRNGDRTQMALLTLSAPEGSPSNAQELESEMRELRTILLNSLRQGDVVSRNSGNQYVILMSNATPDSCRRAMDRVMENAGKRLRNGNDRLSCQLRGLGKT